jgi:hypothetical protein
MKYTLALYRSPAGHLGLELSTLPIKLVDKNKPSDLNITGEVLDLFEVRLLMPYGPTAGLVRLVIGDDIQATIEDRSEHSQRFTLITSKKTPQNITMHNDLRKAVQRACGAGASNVDIYAPRILKALARAGWRHSSVRGLK